MGRGRRDQRAHPRARPRQCSRRTAWPRRSGSRASWATAREHYQAALVDRSDQPHRRAQHQPPARAARRGRRNDRRGQARQQGAACSIFVEETGKTGFACLFDLAIGPSSSRRSTPATRSSWCRDGPRLRATRTASPIGAVEPRVAARLLKLIAEGNKYAAGVTSLGDKDVRIIIREIYQDPRNYGKVSFPTAAKASDLRPYTKGTLVREEMDLEEDLELDEEDEEIEDIGAVLPAEVTEDEAFIEEPEDIEEE